VIDNPRALTVSELEGQRRLTEIFAASMVPFETAARMRRHFVMGPRFWTLKLSADPAISIAP
jgi:hypothetical protein